MKAMTLVKFNHEPYKGTDQATVYRNIFGDEIWVYLGEITNMKGHGIYANFVTGRMLCGYHIENFIELEGGK